MRQQNDRYDLSEIRFVKRIVIGSLDPERPMSPAECDERTKLLNKCLSEPPKGTIIALEKAGLIHGAGEQQVALQQITYHVGFSRKPYWLNDDTQTAFRGIPFPSSIP